MTQACIPTDHRVPGYLAARSENTDNTQTYDWGGVGLGDGRVDAVGPSDATLGWGCSLAQGPRGNAWIDRADRNGSPIM